jgi:hypothetical protein
MAEGIARALAPASVKVSSAGSKPSRLNPLAVKALSEIGLDISKHYSKVAPRPRPRARVTTGRGEVLPPLWAASLYSATTWRSRSEAKTRHRFRLRVQP